MLASDPVLSEGLKFRHTCMTACNISLGGGGGGGLWPIYRISLTHHHHHTHTHFYLTVPVSSEVLIKISILTLKIFRFEFGTVLTVLHFCFSFYYPGIISISYNTEAVKTIIT